VNGRGDELLGLDDGQADGDELAEELEDLLRGHHVLLPDDVPHLQQQQ
jgi:hypothetical protein